MSSTPAQPANARPEPREIFWLRRIRFPIIVLALFGLIFAIPWIGIAMGFEDNWLPLPLIMLTQWLAPLLAVLIITIWWLFFASFHWAARLCLFVMAIVVIGAGANLFVRNFELTMGRVGLVPHLEFTWQPSAADEQAEFNKTQKPAAEEGKLEILAYVGQNDFARYRGANADGLVRWANLETDWEKTPPTVQWKRPCPGGYGGVAIAGSIAVTLEQRNQGETVACYDRHTGRELWAYSYDVYYKDKNSMGDGPRSTPTIHDGHVYAIGATGIFTCLDTNGKKKWSTNVLDDAKAKNMKWGLTASPLIVDDTVIALAGIDKDAPIESSVIAYDLADGKIRWRAGKRPSGYSSPQLATFAGTQQILIFDGAGLVAYEPKTGKELWQFPWITQYEMNSIQPVVLPGDRVFISSELDNGCAMLHVKVDNDKATWSVETVWAHKKFASRYANPVTDGKSIFGLHNMAGVLMCLDADDGAIKWKGESEGPGQLLLAENALIVMNGTTGDIALFDPQASRANELARFNTFGDKSYKTWNTPALAGDQLYVRNQRQIVCLKLPPR